MSNQSSPSKYTQSELVEFPIDGGIHLGDDGYCDFLFDPSEPNDEDQMNVENCHQHFFLNPTEMLVAVVFIFVCSEEDEVEDEAIKQVLPPAALRGKEGRERVLFC